MPVAFISHPACRRHQMGDGHPEQPARLDAIEELLHVRQLHDFLVHHEAPRATFEQLARVHPRAHIERLSSISPSEGLVRVDPDTAMCPDTFEAALRAAGANVLATDLVIEGHVRRAFCNVRPPGHHAERGQAMGFCFFNNVAVGIRHALDVLGLQRVALVDFDVHHGNGSEDILAGDERVLMVSSFQARLYPYLGENPKGRNMCNVALPPYSDGTALRRAVTDHWVPALRSFAPELVFVSAGFDAHREDDMSQLGWSDADYAWVTKRVVEIADECAQGRVVSMLEGGYHLPALARCVELHLRALIGID